MFPFVVNNEKLIFYKSGASEINTTKKQISPLKCDDVYVMELERSSSVCTPKKTIDLAYFFQLNQLKAVTDKKLALQN